MITAVDTSVLIDVFGSDPTHEGPSAEALRQSIREGRLVASSPVWAEVTAAFPSAPAATAALSALGVTFDAITSSTAAAAGDAWRAYRRRGGGRDRVIADFLIGSHGALQADRLLTRDRGFYGTYFDSLTVFEPVAPA